MITQMPSKTYSRKRRRALSDPTDSPSTGSPFPAASASSKNVQDTKRTCTTLKYIAKSGATGPGSIEVSPERPSKKMKKHSSSTTTPSTRLGIPSSVPRHSALTSDSLPLTSLTTSDTKSSYPSLPLRNANDLLPPSTSEHSIKSSTSLHKHESGLKQSNAGQPLPFRRTRSQTQKENVLARPHTLGSPFQIAPTSSLQPHTSNTKAANLKQLRSSRFVRRPSADIFRAHTSPSASFRRRPSGSHALQKKSTQNQDWLVAPPRAIPSSADGNTATLDPEIDINRSHSFFSPQGSSTPLPLRRPIHYGTPMTPTPSIPSGNKDSSPCHPQDSVMSDTKSSPEESSVRTPDPASDLYTSSPRVPSVIGNSQESSTQPPHRVLHLPHDSIFSSFDVSASATTVRVLAHPRLAPDEVVEERDEQLDTLLRPMPDCTNTSPVPEGNKLHDMFSVLALAGSFATLSKTSSHPVRRTKETIT